MKTADFDYACPATLEEALSLLAKPDREVMPLAGGQSLMPMMNFRLSAPDLLVDLNAIEGLAGLTDEGDAITIGAMTRYADLDQSTLVATELPMIKQAIPFIAHPAIRNRGTIGGSVALADPAAEMPALCLALKATITALSLDGEWTIPADDFFLGLYETALRPGEIVKSISFPKTVASRHFLFDELARRHGDYAMVGLAMTAETVRPLTRLRLAFFGIGDRAIRAIAAEDALIGHAPDDDLAFRKASDAIKALPTDGDLNASADTKKHLATVLLRRALGKLG